MSIISVQNMTSCGLYVSVKMHSFVDNIINCKHSGAYMNISCIQIITDYMRVHSSWCCQHNWIVRCALNNKKTTSVSSCYYSLYSRIEFSNSSYRICTRFLALWSVICSSTFFYNSHHVDSCSCRLYAEMHVCVGLLQVMMCGISRVRWSSC